MEIQIRDVDGNMLTVGEDMVGIFRSYFDELLNLDNGRQHSNYQMHKSQG